MSPKAPLDDARSQTSSLDEQEIRLLRSNRLDKSFALMLIVDAMIVIGVIYASVATPDFPDFWMVICLIPVAFILLVITLGAEAEWRFLRKDLQAGTKACCDGHIASLCMHDDGESPTTYRIGVVVDDPESPFGFSVPQEVYDAVEEGQAVRVVYAPFSRILLELKTETCAYLATSAKPGKTETQRTAPDAPTSAH